MAARLMPQKYHVLASDARAAHQFVAKPTDQPLQAYLIQSGRVDGTV